jgi:hypothetical protein
VVTVSPPPERPTSLGFASGAAWFGLVSTALSVGGAVAIAAFDDVPSERITRGVWLGYTAAAVPIVALGSYITRKRAKLPGYKGLRVVGWLAYTGMLSNGAFMWYAAFQDAEQSWGLTVGLSALGLLALLPHSFEAYACGRQARIQRLLSRLTPTPSGFGLRF